MNWIDMTDREKLYNFAKNFVPAESRVFSSKNNANSYYSDYGDESNTNDLDIMEYSVEHYGQLKKHLVDMWDNAGFKEPELLATIVSATAMKNMPKKVEPDTLQEKHSDLHEEPIKKEDYENVNTDDGPPVFVYEF